MKKVKRHILIQKADNGFYAMNLYFDLLDWAETKEKALEMLNESTSLYLSCIAENIIGKIDNYTIVRKAPITFWLIYYLYRIFKKEWAL